MCPRPKHLKHLMSLVFSLLISGLNVSLLPEMPLPLLSLEIALLSPCLPPFHELDQFGLPLEAPFDAKDHEDSAMEGDDLKNSAKDLKSMKNSAKEEKEESFVRSKPNLDPLSYNGGPITRARAKKMKEAIVGLILLNLEPMLNSQSQQVKGQSQLVKGQGQLIDLSPSPTLVHLIQATIGLKSTSMGEA